MLHYHVWADSAVHRMHTSKLSTYNWRAQPTQLYVPQLAEEHRRRTLKKQYLKWQRQLLKHGAADDNSDVPLENLKLPARFKGQSLSRQSADARSEPSESSDDDMDLSDHELSGWQGLQPGEGDESENDLLDEPGSDGDPELY